MRSRYAPAACVAALLVLAASAAHADRRQVKFKFAVDDPGIGPADREAIVAGEMPIDDLHIEYESALPLDVDMGSTSPFPSERVDLKVVNGMRSVTLWGEAIALEVGDDGVPRGEATVTLTTPDGTPPVIEEWYWTTGGNALREGQRVGNTRRTDDGGGELVSADRRVGPGVVAVALGARVERFEVAGGDASAALVALGAQIEARFVEDGFAAVYTHLRSPSRLLVRSNILGDVGGRLTMTVAQEGVGGRLMVRPTTPVERGGVPGDFDGDGQLTPRDALGTLAAARGLRPVLTGGPSEPLARGEAIIVSGLNLGAASGPPPTFALRDTDAVPPRLRRVFRVEPLPLDVGPDRVAIPLPDAIEAETDRLVLEATRVTVDPESGLELPFVSNPMTVSLRPIEREVPLICVLPDVANHGPYVVRAGRQLAELGVAEVVVLESSLRGARFELLDREGSPLGQVVITGEWTEDPMAVTTVETRRFEPIEGAPIEMSLVSVMPHRPGAVYPSAVVYRAGDVVFESSYDLLVEGGADPFIREVNLVAGELEMRMTADELAQPGATARYEAFLVEAGAGVFLEHPGMRFLHAVPVDDQLLPYTPMAVYYATKAGDSHDGVERDIPPHSFWGCVAACGTHAACYFGAQIPPPCWVACAICGWCGGEAIWGQF